MKNFNEFQTSSLYDEYWKFAAERQAIFYKRNILKQHSPWTKIEFYRNINLPMLIESMTELVNI